MDHLPNTLLCLLNTVVEQYIEFSWTSQEQKRQNENNFDIDKCRNET